MTENFLNRETLKQLLKEKYTLPDGRINWHLTRNLKKENSDKEYQIFKISLLKETSYLDQNVIWYERYFHILNDFFETPICPNCKNNKINFNKMAKQYYHHCSSHCSSTTEYFLSKSVKYGKDHPLYGKPCTEERRKNISNSKKGKPIPAITIEKIKEHHKKGTYKILQSPEVIEKRSAKLRGKPNLNARGRSAWNKGIPNTPEQKRKIRNTILKNIERNHGIVFPGYNKLSIEFFKRLDTNLDTKGQYAVYGGGEYKIEYLGYFLDYINFDLKLIIEWDEKYHFEQDGNLSPKDVLREKEIKEYYPDYQFIRIKQSDYLDDEKTTFNYLLLLIRYRQENDFN